MDIPQRGAYLKGTQKLKEMQGGHRFLLCPPYLLLDKTAKLGQFNVLTGNLLDSGHKIRDVIFPRA